MCLILFAYKVHPRFKLVLGANRDEFYARPTAPLEFWRDHPHVLAGRDLEQNGTWMGMTHHGRLAAITNYRDPRAVKTGAPSRGHLVADFLTGHTPPEDYLRRIAVDADRYNGFNLIVGDADNLLYFSNRGNGIHHLPDGIYGLSNHLLDTPWPKVVSGKRQLRASMAQDPEISLETMMHLLQDQTIADDDHLPSTGIELAWERLLSSIFITSPVYGTRSSSVLMIGTDGRIHFSERTWKPAQAEPREEFTRAFDVDPASPG